MLIKAFFSLSICKYRKEKKCKKNINIFIFYLNIRFICNNLTMKSSYLKGNIICALPQLKDIFFSKSIIYITHHNKDGAVGIVLNYKILNIKGAELFKKLHIKDTNQKPRKGFFFSHRWSFESKQRVYTSFK